MTNPFKKLFENRKKANVRQDLVVSLDDRATGEQEVLVMRTTSLENIIVMSKGEKISVNPDDMVEALGMIKTFQEARPAQPGSLRPSGIKQMNELEKQETKAVEQIKQEEKKIIDLSN